jgi:hypothetical protein
VESESLLKKELCKTKDLQQSLSKSNEELKSKYEKDITQFNQQKDGELQDSNERITELENFLKEVEDENEAMKQKIDKDMAINQQKMEFLQVQLDQERGQRQDEKKNHDRMLKSIQSSQRESVIGKEEATKQLDDLKNHFQQECHGLQDQYDKQSAVKEKEIHTLTESCQKLELEM